MSTLLQNDYHLLEEKTDVLKTMGHPIRLSIVQLLVESEEMTVTEIYSKLNIEQAVASHHLRIMKNANVLLSTKHGKHVHYSLAEESIKMVFLSLFPMANQ